MDKSREILIVCFYLAKYDRKALENLGYNTFSSAFKDIAKKLNSKPNTINNRRDDFDPLFNYRAGWHQRELTSTKLSIINNFDHLSEHAFTEIVKDILSKKNSLDLSIISDNPESYTYTTRGVTGKKAEEYFIEWFHNNHPNISLKDSRVEGVGYDFLNEDNLDVYEVKGLAGVEGGLLLTDKEWVVANQLKNKYHIVLVRNCLTTTPEISIYTNPTEIFKPQKKVIPTINVNWIVDPKELT